MEFHVFGLSVSTAASDTIGKSSALSYILSDDAKSLKEFATRELES
jgi:hypothetical protein